jgi:hypothetical protein
MQMGPKKKKKKKKKKKTEILTSANMKVMYFDQQF